MGQNNPALLGLKYKFGSDSPSFKFLPPISLFYRKTRFSQFFPKKSKIADFRANKERKETKIDKRALSLPVEMFSEYIAEPGIAAPGVYI